MFRALLRKQMLEIRNRYLTGGKGLGNKKKKEVKNPVGMYILFAVLFLFIMGAIFLLCTYLGGELLPKGYDWLYFTIMNIMAFILGIFGSVMSTATAIFRSTDNELLLSMPIPPSSIVAVRMISVYLMGFLYESAILVPTVVYYLIFGNVTALSAIFSILGIFIMGFLVAAFSCAAGWLVSLIASKLKNQKILTVLLVVILIAVFMYFRIRADVIFRAIAGNADVYAQHMHGPAYPLFVPGLGMSGHILEFVLFLVVTAILFGLAFFAVSRSFSRIALMQTTEKERKFKETDIKVSSLSDTLLRRELKRFLSSVNYMLNAGLGILFLIALAILILIQMGNIRNLLTQIGSDFPQISELMPVMLACATCLITGLCMIASCSISMEGKQIWIYQSMPVDPYQIFLAKIKLHLILTGIPALLMVLAGGIVCGVDIPQFICMILFTLMYIMMCASFELMMDLKRPKLNWTNETQALKNNFTVFLDMLITVLLPAIVGTLYYLVLSIMGPVPYMAVWVVIFAALTLLVHRWLSKTGRKVFQTL